MELDRWLGDKTIIAFTGLKGSGKSTAADRLVEKHGFEKMAFADPLKQAVQVIFRLDYDQLQDPDLKEKQTDLWGKTPRKIMQLFGTEVGRQIDSKVWIKNLIVRMAESPSDRIAVEDCRFLNEAEAIRTVGGKVIGLRRKLDDRHDSTSMLEYFLSAVGVSFGEHASENEMVRKWRQIIDREIDNTSTKEHLFNQLDAIV